MPVGKQTGEDEIRKLLIEYSIVKESNAILNTSAHSLTGTFNEWRERLKFIGISCGALQAKYPALTKILAMLLKICKQEDILPEQLKALYSELVAHGAEIRELLNNEGAPLPRFTSRTLKTLVIAISPMLRAAWELVCLNCRKPTVTAK